MRYVHMEGKSYPIDSRGMLEPIDGISSEEQDRLDRLYYLVAAQLKPKAIPRDRGNKLPHTSQYPRNG